MQSSEIIGWSCLVFYLLGYIIHFRMFVREKDSLYGDGWLKVFVALYFSFLSWFAVIMTWGCNTKSKPPKWIVGK
jgi:hypothetical protein